MTKWGAGAPHSRHPERSRGTSSPRRVPLRNPAPNAGTRWSCALVAIVAVFLLLVTVVRAGATTPTAYDTDPARCTIEPRTLANLESILHTATPVAPTNHPVSGDPIDLQSETGRAVTATIETLIACLDAGDRLRAYALYTDAYLAVILQPGDLPTAGTPQAVDADERTHIVAIDLHALADGRVRATVTLDPALIPVHKIFDFILLPVDGHWRIDAVINEIDFSLP